MILGFSTRFWCRLLVVWLLLSLFGQGPLDLLFRSVLRILGMLGLSTAHLLQQVNNEVSEVGFAAVDGTLRLAGDLSQVAMSEGEQQGNEEGEQGKEEQEQEEQEQEQ